MWQQRAYEQLAESIRSASSVPRGLPAHPCRMMQKLHGKRSVFLVKRETIDGEDCRLCGTPANPTVLVVEDLEPARFVWSIAYSLATLALWECRERDVEESRNRLAAALICPNTLLREEFAPQQAALSLTAIAKACGTTETCVALRYGEVSGPVAVVAPDHVHLRRLLPASKLDLRYLAKFGATGIQRVVLSDDPSRVALFAAA